MLQKIFWFTLLILFSAFFSGVEIAFFSLNRAKVRTLIRKKVPGAKTVDQLRSRPQRLLITVLLGNNLVNIFAAALATEIALITFGSLGVGIATGIVTLLVLVFGEIIPKSFARQRAAVIACRTARVIHFLQYCFSPIILPLEKLLRIITPPSPRDRNRALVVEEEIRSLMHIGVEEGSVERHEHEFMERLFRFNDVRVASVMTPLSDVLMLDGDRSVEEVMRLVVQSGYSRFPVYRDVRQNIIGVVHMKDIVRTQHSDRRRDPLVSIAGKAWFLSDDAVLDDAFRMMQTSRTPCLFIRNAKKEILGMATREDVLEELVGEIDYESDGRKRG